MPKGYWIPHLDVQDMKGFQAYRDTADAAPAGSARSCWRGAAVAGCSKARCGRAMCCANSTPTTRRTPSITGRTIPAAHPLREPFSECDFLVVEGFDGEQPVRVSNAPAPAALKGYWIVHIDVTDVEGYKPYQAAASAAFSVFGARYMIRGGRQEIMEGRTRARVAWWSNFGATTLPSRVIVRPNTARRSTFAPAKPISTWSPSKASSGK